MRLPPALLLSLFCFSIKPLSLFKWYKLKRLASLEDRLKKDKEITSKEREKLFDEVGEIRREINKELRD
jgi:hypothetical protein